MTANDRLSQTAPTRASRDLVNPEAIPAALRDLPQWAVYRNVRRDGKTTKVPYQAKNPGSNASHSDPATWATFAAALAALSGGFDGVMFAFSEADDFVGVDLDGCVADRGGLEPWAARVVEGLGSYTELSPSGRGVHVILRGKLPGGRRGRKRGPVEVYEACRFFTMTGRGVRGKLEARQAALDAFFGEHFPPPEPTKRKKRAPVSLGDRKLLELMFASRNGSSIQALWDGDFSAYPSQSEADLALLGHLGWWTGYDRERTAALFERSGLHREKWEREDYREGQLTLVFGG